MNIVICGSMSSSKEMLSAQQRLVELGHNVVVPEFTAEYAALEQIDKALTESARNKVKYDFIRGYFKKIQESDALLVVNVRKREIEGYIGANAFLEMGFAHVLNKPVFLLHASSEGWHSDEIKAMQPTILNGRLEDIR